MDDSLEHTYAVPPVDEQDPLEHTYAVPPLEHTYAIPPLDHTYDFPMTTEFRVPPPFLPNNSTTNSGMLLPRALSPRSSTYREQLQPLDEPLSSSRRTKLVGRKKKKRPTKLDTGSQLPELDTQSQLPELTARLPEPYFATSTPQISVGGLPPMRMRDDLNESTNRYDIPNCSIKDENVDEAEEQHVERKTRSDSRPKKPILRNYPPDEDVRSDVSSHPGTTSMKTGVLPRAGTHIDEMNAAYQDPEQLYHHGSQNNSPSDVDGQRESCPSIRDFYVTGESEKPNYKQMAIELATRKHPPSKHPLKFSDYVLVYPSERDHGDVTLDTERKEFQARIKKMEGLVLMETTLGSKVHVEIFCPFERLCEEAEKIALQMPLSKFSMGQENKRTINMLKSRLEVEEEMTFVSAPFTRETLHMFHGCDDRKTFFRPAYRSLLVHGILERTKSEEVVEEPGLDPNKMAGLSGLLHNGAYCDAYILHERSKLDQSFSKETTASDPPAASEKGGKDRRQNLANTWLKMRKYQPLRKIRNYFGEKIAFYFAWLGVLITSLWVPAVIGIIVFIYGFIESYNQTSEGENRWDEASSSDLTSTINKLKMWVLNALDNGITPYFALIVCLWGTIFLELWKRKNAELAYKWDVEDFEEQEPNRPEFYGTKLVKDPYTGAYEQVYPKWRKVLKSMGSISVILFMVTLVCGSVFGILLFKMVSRVTWRGSALVSTVTASVLNSVSILMLGFFYKKLAYRLTHWENHRTRTRHEDALIFKLFGFQFVNCYAVLFYIAFFRESSKIAVGGEVYSDDCSGADNSCMALLSLQVATNMIIKPLPKLFSDIVIPFFLIRFKKCRKSNAVGADTEERKFSDSTLPEDREYERFLTYEYSKAPLVDFTLSEFTEKVIQYGYLMLFAAAFPLAPLIAIITNLIDMRVDARRLLTFNRRPLPERAEDIGMWFTILTFLNYCGVITNAFIVGMTSKFGQNYRTEVVLVTNYTCTCIGASGIMNNMTSSIASSSSLDDPTSNFVGSASELINSTLSMLATSALNSSVYSMTSSSILATSSTTALLSNSMSTISSNGSMCCAQPQPTSRVEVQVWSNLWIIIIFENVVLMVKFILSYAIPDIPEHIARAMIKERFELDRILDTAGLKRGPGKTISLDTGSALNSARTSKTPRMEEEEKEEKEAHVVRRSRTNKSPRRDSKLNLIDEDASNA